jgi:hypothetical protein
MEFDADNSLQYKESFAGSFDWPQSGPDTGLGLPRLSFMSDLEDSLKLTEQQPNSELNEAILEYYDDEDASNLSSVRQQDRLVSDLRNLADAMQSSKGSSLLRSQKGELPPPDELRSRTTKNPTGMAQPKIALERTEVQGCWSCNTCLQVNGGEHKAVCSVM